MTQSDPHDTSQTELTAAEAWAELRGLLRTATEHDGHCDSECSVCAGIEQMDAALARNAVKRTGEGRGPSKARVDLWEALDALAHMQRAAAERGAGLKCADDVLTKHGITLAKHRPTPPSATEGLEAAVARACRLLEHRGVLYLQDGETRELRRALVAARQASPENGAGGVG